MSAPPPALGSHEFERLQRKDSLGETWRALDCRSGRKMDLRLLPEWVDLADLGAFIEQAVAVAHPALIATHGLISEGGRAAIILETSDGETVPQRRARRPRRHFEVSEIKPWLRTIVDVLERLHEEGLPHGALSGGSFLVEGPDLKVTDLAVSRLMRPQPRFDGAALMPIASMSPQAAAGAAPSVADDIYAVGSFVYDLLTGGPVFHSGDIATQVQSSVPLSVYQRRAQLEIQSALVPQPWEDWLAAALAKDPAKRPSLKDLRQLLASGSLATGAAHAGADSGSFSAAASASAAAASSSATGSRRPRVSPNHLIIGGAAAAILLIFSGVYVFKIAPRNAFKTQLDAAYAEVSAFDARSPGEHDDVISRWDQFHRDWQARVAAEHPAFLPVLSAAQEQRDRRETQLNREKERLRAEAQENRRLYINKARDDFSLTQAKAAAASTRESAITEWEGFLTRADVPYEQEAVPTELAASIVQAKAARESLLRAIEEDKNLVTEHTTRLDAELARLQQTAADPTTGAASKITQVQALLAQLDSAPRAVVTAPQIQELRNSAALLLAHLHKQAEMDTPKEPLDLQGLFAASPGKEFSENGRKRLLREVQAALKAQSLYNGTPDGSTGQATHEALIAFQKSKNLPPSAALDAATLEALGLVEVKDDPSPMAAAAARRSSSSSSRKGPSKEEDKGFLNKVGDGAKNVGKSIGGLFSGDKKGNDKKKK